MTECPKCGSTNIRGPHYEVAGARDYYAPEALRYTCARCGYSQTTPTKDAEERGREPLGNIPPSSEAAVAKCSCCAREYDDDDDDAVWGVMALCPGCYDAGCWLTTETVVTARHPKCDDGGGRRCSVPTDDATPLTAEEERALRQWACTLPPQGAAEGVAISTRRLFALLDAERAKVAALEQEQALIDADTQRGITDCSTPLFQRVRNMREGIERLEAAHAETRRELDEARAALRAPTGTPTEAGR